MANPEHLELLKQGVEKWNEWRKAATTIPDDILNLYPYPDRDLESTYKSLMPGLLPEYQEYAAKLLEWQKSNPDLIVDLSGATLNSTHLIAFVERGTDLTKLTEADITKLTEAGFTQPATEGFDLTEFNLSRANLKGANLRLVNLTRADLTHAELAGANLYQADLYQANLSEANLTEADLTIAQLTDANLKSVKLNHANLSSATLVAANLNWADLTMANLSGANLTRANLSDANFYKADLSDAILFNAKMDNANLRNAILRGAHLSDVKFIDLNMSDIDLSDADLFQANMKRANLSRANLTGANLRNAIMVETNLSAATITGCQIYGISAWNLELQNAIQKDLIISNSNEPTITVDDLSLGQFIHLLLNNKNIRNVLNSITSKGVLILGRFADPQRKAVLDGLREKLRRFDLLPIVFDFDRPTDKDYTETVQTLAGISKFVIVDITDPKSTPLELEATIKHFKIPYLPIIDISVDPPFAMFVDLQKSFHWVLPTLQYETKEDLLDDDNLKEYIIDPVNKKREELRKAKNEEPEPILIRKKTI